MKFSVSGFMSVFTTVTVEQLEQWLQAYPLGKLLDLQGIASGITNTNYFVTTTDGRFVLTLFEKNTPDELPYFINLMSHLSERGIPCPHPVANLDGICLGELSGKPAVLVSCLRGQDIDDPSVTHCAEVGRVLAEMHIAGQTFPFSMADPRGRAWRRATAEKVAAFLSDESRILLESELVSSNSMVLDDLVKGVIHADLFRDNVLFDDRRVSGLIDFYYACNDALLYDVAIAANDWCSVTDGSLDESRLKMLLEAYHAVRPLTEAERRCWPAMLRVAALRFWLSRLYDLYFPQEGELTHAKDPQHFERILKQHIRQQQKTAGIWV